MDPDKALAETRALARAVLYQLEHNGSIDEYDAAQLAEHVMALDEWIAAGGFLPEDWQTEKSIGVAVAELPE